jgi:AcrR family transcriptional regulator
MGRWEPGARERLRETALQLYAERGFDETTAADIAGAVGLTERTFFRHFSDKREVLFGGQEVLERSFVTGVADAPAGAAPLAVVASAIVAGSEFFTDDRRAHSRLRQSVIAANAELRERELLKMASLAAAVAAALRERGVAEPSATLSAESGVTVFRVAYGQWIAEGEGRPLTGIAREIFAELGALTAAASADRPSGRAS